MDAPPSLPFPTNRLPRSPRTPPPRQPSSRPPQPDSTEDSPYASHHGRRNLRALSEDPSPLQFKGLPSNSLHLTPVVFSKARPLSTKDDFSMVDIPMTLPNLLRRMPLRCPPILEHAAKNTRLPGKKEVRMLRCHPLKGILLNKTMIHDLVEAAEAYLNSFVYQMPLDPSIPSESRFIASVNPVQMGANLPLVIHSEGDSHAWICSVIVRPVCQLLRLDPLSDVAPALIGPSAEGPDCRTNCGGAPHPDGCFWSNGRIFMTLESKSPAILPYSDDGENTYPFKDLVTYLEKVRPSGSPTVARYGIPITHRKQVIGRLGCAERLILQVWGHMSAKDVDYAVLSSYASTTFFVRQDGYLYMSEPEELTANYLLSWFGFAAIASGKISKRSILLETPDEDDTLDAGLLGLSLGSD